MMELISLVTALTAVTCSSCVILEVLDTVAVLLPNLVAGGMLVSLAEQDSFSHVHSVLSPAGVRAIPWFKSLDHYCGRAVNRRIWYIHRLSLLSPRIDLFSRLTLSLVFANATPLRSSH